MYCLSQLSVNQISHHKTDKFPTSDVDITQKIFLELWTGSQAQKHNTPCPRRVFTSAVCHVNLYILIIIMNKPVVILAGACLHGRK